MAGETRKGSLLPDVTSPEASDLVFLLRNSEAQPIARNKKISFANLLRTAITSVIKFTQSGTGAVERTVDSKLKETVSVTDFGETVSTTTVNQAAGIAASAKRTLRFPATTTLNFTFSQPPYNSSWEFEGVDLPATVVGGPTTVRVGRPTLTIYDGIQPDFRRSAFYDRVVSKGSGVNGPARAAYVRELDIRKEGFGTGTCNRGEIDGLYIVVRNDRNISDSTSYSDSGGILMDVDQMEGTGFACLMEGMTKTIDRSTFGIKKNINVQLAPMNEVPGAVYSYGIVLTANTGSHTAGVLVQSPSASQAFQDLFVGRVASKSFSFRLLSDGTTQFFQAGVTNNTLRFRPNGKLAIGGNGADAISFYNHLQLGDGAGPAGFLSAGAVDSTATASAAYYQSQANVLSNVVLTKLSHFEALWGTIAANVNIGSYVGLEIAGTSLSNVYGVRSNLQSGSNRWNLFCSGTAWNYLAGNLAIGGFAAFHTSSTATIGIATGTEPPGAAPGAVQIYSYSDIPDNTMLGIRTQNNAVVTEPLTADRSLRVRINGTTYKLLLKSI
jgi:hypothetical protein